MAEYECFPTWLKDTGDAIFENIAIDNLPISEQLKVKMKEWDATYQSTYNAETPQDSGFTSNSEEEIFEKDGLALAKEINSELGSDFVVSYRNRMKGITLYPLYY